MRSSAEFMNSGRWRNPSLHFMAMQRNDTKQIELHQQQKTGSNPLRRSVLQAFTRHSSILSKLFDVVTKYRDSRIRAG